MTSYCYVVRASVVTECLALAKKQNRIYSYIRVT
jgi:hypothetical protein